MIPLILFLFAFWVVLSGKFDAFHLGIGAASACCIAWGTHRLLYLPPTIGPHGVHPVAAIPWIRLLLYIPWLLWQIILSSVQVAVLVIHPKMPIQPHLIRFRKTLPHALAQFTLATSITMTPGTITLDVHNDEFVVHALTERSAKALTPPDGKGSMPSHVAALYSSSQDGAS